MKINTTIKHLLLFSCFLIQSSLWAQIGLTTPWTNEVTAENIHPEYPRPQMVREAWKNLNGEWDYAILPLQQDKPATWQGKIKVPFPVESMLSGVTKTVGPDSTLWYFRSFTIPNDWQGQQILLHFEAVDWRCQVWVNGKFMGDHQGGYDAFTFDITTALQDGEEQELTVSVWDPTDAGFQPVGKQAIRPRSIWYTPSTGIWQTVWLEPVPQASIEGLVMTPNIDNNQLHLQVKSHESYTEYEVEATAYDQGEEVATVRGRLNELLALEINDRKLWSPDNPFLYDLEVSLIHNNQQIDQVKSYFGMREIRLGKDEDGFVRLFLNDEPLFHFGTLDQGFWPDGLYTAPTEEAMKYDIEVTKDLGFNMIRKHVKVEPKTWYYWCDRMGMLVWQDMPNGDKRIRREEPDIERTAQSAYNYRQELKELIEEHYNYPSIVTWVPFNEGWGQFQTKEIAAFVENLDSTRLVDATSGWADRQVGDMHDIHSYPGPDMPETEENRAAVLGEFGGQAYVDKDHLWINDFSKAPQHYKTSPSQAELVKKYDELISKLLPLKEKGLAAAVYTQTTDVESEVNGLMTYDRKVLKFDKAHMKKMHDELIGNVQ